MWSLEADKVVLVYGISMIRNEADLVRLNMLYNSAVGIEHRLIVDNGSTDGTDQILKELSRQDPRVRWTRDEGPYRQTEIHTELAREAYRDGADWVVQIDADEFWYAPKGNLKSVLAGSEAGVLRAQVLNYIQRRGQRESSPDALLYMTRRAAKPVGKGAQDLVEARRLGFVEKLYPRKCISRPNAEIRIEAGNHKVYDADGPSENTNDVFCLHAPIRSRAALEERVRTAARPAAAGRKPGQGRYRRMLGELRDEKAVEQHWAANSYDGDFLDVYGEKHPVLFDPRLRDAVAPFVPQPLWRRLYRRLGLAPRGAES
jgi:glycosyltransferase involved in cell wall biosynthesis